MQSEKYPTSFPVGAAVALDALPFWLAIFITIAGYLLGVGPATGFVVFPRYYPGPQPFNGDLMDPKTKIQDWNVEAMYQEYLAESERIDAEMEAEEHATA